MDRTQKLQSIRPTIASAKIMPNMSEDERFQNETLRPILKLQNDLLLASFQNYIKKMKNSFYELKIEKRIDYIAKSIQKDIKFRNSLKGMIIGQFTAEEYDIYIKNSSALNKRMMNMVVKRIQDQIQYFEKYDLVQKRFAI
ncbi:glyoxalase [Maribacter aquivivus]|uniref:glyoxalase n=1 Tax=Maribacter aquivivus TaxID=228958 RepID=UPI002490B660|nr:glyoxalase [Maribacter aquivivus]